MSDPAVAGLLLAAGASRRLGTPKQLLRDAGGTPLVRRMALALEAAGCAPVVVVTGAAAEAVAEALRGLAVQLVFNPAYADGMGHSIAAGADAIAHRCGPATAALVVVPCDMPSVDAEHLRALRSASRGGARRVASVYPRPGDSAGAAPVRGIPALFPRTDWPRLRALAGDTGARALLRDPDTGTVPLAGGSFDLDTAADVARWRQPAAPPTAAAPRPPDLPIMASTLFQTALGDLAHEFAQTRRMLERLPADQLGFSPHPKSWPLQKLARHLCDFPEWALVTLQTTELAFDAPMAPKVLPTDAAGFLALWDAGVAALEAHLPSVTDEALHVHWQATFGGQPVISGPRIQILRGMVLNHMIHHRAQLSIYYRMVGVPMPGLYGPSADER